ncbi:unnamed protein product, partial [Pleuronectes platessa]
MDEGEGDEKEKEGEEGGESRVIFNVVNFSKTKSLYRDGMSPVVKSTSRPKWLVYPVGRVRPRGALTSVISASCPGVPASFDAGGCGAWLASAKLDVSVRDNWQITVLQDVHSY